MDHPDDAGVDSHRGSQPAVPRAIVVGVDGSAASAAALHWAAEQSRRTGEPLRVVHSWQLEPAGPAGAGAALQQATGAHARAKATRWVRATLDPIPGTRWVLGVVEGPPGPTLVELSRDASLLVVGTRRQVGPHRVPAGSVSRYALSHSVTPVVAVPAAPPAPSPTPATATATATAPVNPST